MKVATITCHRVYNHGASLQEYALAKYLQSLGYDVEIIDYTPNRGGFTGRKIFNKPILKQLYHILKCRSTWRSKKRKRAFDNFETLNIAPMMTSNNFDSHNALQSKAPEADIYIAGSDQIWNTLFPNGTDPSYYLDFGCSAAKRISYAASFATNKLREGTEDFVKKHLQNFNSISVRETSGIDILKSLGYIGQVVCDPVFLLDRSEWDKIADSSFSDENYVLVYDMLMTPEIKNVAKRIAKNKRIKIYSVGAQPLHYADKNFTMVGPDMFISLVRNATLVISNSFHGTVFSMIYNIPFFVVNRHDGLNDRMSDLLNRYGIFERLIDGSASTDQLLKPVNFEQINKFMKADISRSMNWLNNSLK